MRRKTAAIVGLIAATSLTTGCVAGVSIPATSQASPSSPLASASPVPAPTELTVTPAPGEPRIATLSSVRGAASTDPVPTRTGRAAVYIRCWGDDIITVQIEDSATITQQCLLDADDPGTRNTLDIVSENVRVAAKAGPDNLWAIVVTEIPAD